MMLSTYIALAIESIQLFRVDCMLTVQHDDDDLNVYEYIKQRTKQYVCLSKCLFFHVVVVVVVVTGISTGSQSNQLKSGAN